MHFTMEALSQMSILSGRSSSEGEDQTSKRKLAAGSLLLEGLIKTREHKLKCLQEPGGSMKRVSRSVKTWKIQRACAHLKRSSSRGVKRYKLPVIK